MATRRVRASSGTGQVEKDELAPLLKEMAKRYGAGIIQKGHEVLQPLRIPTKVFPIDYCLLGGIPVSRGTMLIGKKHSGKTTISYSLAGSAQEMFPQEQVAIVDIEGTYDAVWASKLGVNTEDLLVIQPESGEAACDIVDALIRTLGVSLVVVDSVAALAPMKEIEGSAEDQNVGLQARLMGQLLRKSTAGMIAERHRGHFVTPVYLNQYRAKIGGFSGFGEPLTVPGGMALGFANSVEIIIKNKETAGKSAAGFDVMAYNDHPFKIEKNKCNGGMRTGEFRLIRQYDPDTGLPEGSIDDAPVMLAFAKKHGIYTGAGSSWSLDVWGEVHNFRGADDAVRQIYQDGALYQRLRDCLVWHNAVSLNMPEEFLRTFSDQHGYQHEP